MVRRQILDIGTGRMIGKPKTRSGEDRIVDTGTVRKLHQLRQSHDRAGGADYIFIRSDGQPWHPVTVSRRFRRLDTLVGVPRCRFHDLRHLAASLQLAAGMDIAIVSKRLGHSTYTITADTYCHLLSGVGRAAGFAAPGSLPPVAPSQRENREGSCVRSNPWGLRCDHAWCDGLFMWFCGFGSRLMGRGLESWAGLRSDGPAV